MKNFILSLCSLLLGSALAFSQDAPEPSEPSALAIEMVKLEGSAETAVDAAMASFAPTLEQLSGMGLSIEGQTRVEESARSFFTDAFSDGRFEEGLAMIYTRNFTDDELSAMIEFYSTPVGAKFLSLLPTIVEQSAALGKEMAEGPRLTQFQDEMQAIMAEHMNQNGAEDTPEPQVEEPAELKVVPAGE